MNDTVWRNTEKLIGVCIRDCFILLLVFFLQIAKIFIEFFQERECLTVTVLIDIRYGRVFDLAFFVSIDDLSVRHRTIAENRVFQTGLPVRTNNFVQTLDEEIENLIIRILDVLELRFDNFIVMLVQRNCIVKSCLICFLELGATFLRCSLHLHVGGIPVGFFARVLDDVLEEACDLLFIEL